MKKKWMKVAVFIVCIAMSLAMFGCDTESKAEIDSMEIDAAGAVTYDAETSMYSFPDLIVTYSDGTTKNVAVTPDMISDEDLAKLGTVGGPYVIGVKYMEKSASFTVTIVGEKGEKGDKGDTGKGIADITVNSKGELVVTYNDGSEPVNLGVVVGKDGEDGAQGATGGKGDKGDTGAAGEDGRGIAEIKVENGKLLVKMTGDTAFIDIGSVKGEQGETGATGEDGRGIVTVDMGADGTITIEYTDGTSTTLETYLTGFTVSFMDGDNVISKQTVKNGYSAVEPTVPAKTGYRFVGWDKTFDNVTADTTVTARYEEVDTSWYKVGQRLFRISTVGEMNGLAELVNTGVDTFAGKIVQLGADIDFADKTWEPIGNWAVSYGKDADGNIYNTEFENVLNAFSGTFDAAGHSVKNLTMTGGAVANDFTPACALFGNVASAVIKNLTVEGFTITGANRVAGVASYAYGNTLFQNITVKSSVFTNNSESWGMGAIFGQCWNYSSFNVAKDNMTVTLDNCKIEKDVTLDGNGVGWNVGSLWGSITEAKDGASGNGLDGSVVVRGCSSAATIKNVKNGTVGRMAGWANCVSVAPGNFTFTGKVLDSAEADITYSVGLIGNGGNNYVLLADGYDAFEAVFTACPAGVTVKLTGDVNKPQGQGIDGRIELKSNLRDLVFKLDLNGYKIGTELNLTSASLPMVVGSDGRKIFTTYKHKVDVTITDSSADKTGSIGASTVIGQSVYYGMVVQGADNMKLKLDGITVCGYYGGLATNGSCAGGAVITATDTKFVGVSNVATVGDAGMGAYLAANDAYSFTGCEFTGFTGLHVKSGTVTLKDCKIDGIGTEYFPPTYNGDGSNATGNGLLVESTVGYAQNLKVTISGGSISSVAGYAIEEIMNAKAGTDPVCYAEVTVKDGTTLTGKLDDVKSQNDKVTIQKAA